MRVPGGDAARAISRAAERGVYAGVSAGRLDAKLGDCLLVAVNEMHGKADIDRLADTLKEVG